MLEWLLCLTGMAGQRCSLNTTTTDVRIGRSRYQEGKASLRQMLLRLHIYRCSADVHSCRELYEDLTIVKTRLYDGEK
jgi:hypothetical protein